MLANEAATADAEAVPPVPVTPGLAEVAALVADPEELHAASRAASAVSAAARATAAPFAGVPRCRPCLDSCTSPIKVRLSRHSRYPQ